MPYGAGRRAAAMQRVRRVNGRRDVAGLLARIGAAPPGLRGNGA
jgi:hypothetical protein